MPNIVNLTFSMGGIFSKKKLASEKNLWALRSEALLTHLDGGKGYFSIIFPKNSNFKTFKEFFFNVTLDDIVKVKKKYFRILYMPKILPMVVKKPGNGYF